MQLPICVFWLYSKNIQRIEAERARRALRVALHAQSGEAAQTLMESLNQELGEPVKFITGDEVPITVRDSEDKIRSLLQI